MEVSIHTCNASLALFCCLISSSRPKLWCALIIRWDLPTKWDCKIATVARFSFSIPALQVRFLSCRACKPHNSKAAVSGARGWLGSQRWLSMQAVLTASWSQVEACTLGSTCCPLYKTTHFRALSLRIETS